VSNRVLNGGTGGAGLWMDGHPTTAGYIHTLLDCTFSGNFMGQTADRIDVVSSSLLHRGMAIYIDTMGSNAVNVDIVQSTFDENVAYMDDDPDPYSVFPLNLHHTVFQANVGGQVRFQNSLVDGDCAATAGGWVSLDGNVYWDENDITGYTCPTTGSDVVGGAGYLSLEFDALVQLNGAWSQCHPNVATIAAATWSGVDFENKTCLGDLSQDMITRPGSGSTCDAGAYEGP